MLPAVPTVEPSSLTVKPSICTVAIPVFDDASTSTNEPEKSNAVIAVPTFASSSLTRTPGIATVQ